MEINEALAFAKSCLSECDRMTKNKFLNTLRAEPVKSYKGLIVFEVLKAGAIKRDLTSDPVCKRFLERSADFNGIGDVTQVPHVLYNKKGRIICNVIQRLRSMFLNSECRININQVVYNSAKKTHATSSTNSDASSSSTRHPLRKRGRKDGNQTYIDPDLAFFEAEVASAEKKFESAQKPKALQTPNSALHGAGPAQRKKRKRQQKV